MNIDSPKAESELLDRVIRDLRNAHVPSFPDPQIRWGDIASESQSKETAVDALPPRQSGTRRLDRRKIFALAATLLVSFSVVLGLLEHRSVLAQIQAAIQEAQSVSFTIETFKDGEPIEKYSVTYLPDGTARAEGERRLHIFNAAQMQLMTVDHADQTAEIRPVYDAGAMQRKIIGVFYHLSQVKATDEALTKRLAEDGRQLLEIQSELDGSVSKVLVDANSMRPVRLEIDRGRDHEERSILEVIDDIEFDRALPADYFALQPPPGYRVDIVERQELKDTVRSFVLSAQSGLGPIEWGMSFDQVVTLIGPPETLDTKAAMVPAMKDGRPVIIPGKGFQMVPADPPSTVSDLRYDSQGFRITVSSIDGVTHIRCFDEGVYGPSSRRFPGRTDEGIAIGMTRADVQRRLGIQSDPPLRFTFHDERLVSVVVGSPE